MTDSNFEEYLRMNTALQESSIQVYTRTINEYKALCEEQGIKDIEIDHIIAFISDAARNKHSPHKKAALSHYLDFSGYSELKEKLPKLKQQPRVKTGNFIKSDLLTTIFKSMPRKYRDIAFLQFALCCRAREILGLREEKIITTGPGSPARIILITKGNRERNVEIDFNFLQRHIENYTTGSAGYMFLPDYAIDADPEEMERILNNERTYYNVRLREAGRLHGITNLASHDIRRSAAMKLWIQTKDIFLVQRILGHARVQTTIIYLHLSSADLGEIILKHQEAINDNI